MATRRVVAIVGGFAGRACARALRAALRRSECEVVLLDREASTGFCVIERGEAEIVCERDDVSDGEVLARLGVRELFGEMALVAARERTPPLRTATSLELRVVGRDVFSLADLRQPRAAARARGGRGRGRLGVGGWRGQRRVDSRHVPRRRSEPTRRGYRPQRSCQGTGIRPCAASARVRCCAR